MSRPVTVITKEKNGVETKTLMNQEEARSLADRAASNDKLISLTTEALPDSGSLGTIASQQFDLAPKPSEPASPNNVAELFERASQPRPAENEHPLKGFKEE